MKKQMLSKSLFLLAVVSLFLACSNTENITREIILAKVGDKTISVNEFIRRAEYTTRPAWCGSDNYIHRKVVLNALIAEKMLALEAGESAALLENPDVKHYLKGRREQAMRQVHFNETALKKIEPDSSELQIAYLNGERTYNLSIIPLNEELALRIGTDLKNGRTTFSALQEEYEAATKKENKIQEFSFNTPFNDEVFKVLFLTEVRDGQIIGPLKTGEGSFALIRVNGWIRRMAMGGEKAALSKSDIREKIIQVRARDKYSVWLRNIMAEKNMEFNPTVFEELVNIVGPDYFKTKEEREKAFNTKFWKAGDGKVYLNNGQGRLEKILDQPLLTIDGKVWTVRHFEQEVKIHPLVFRNRRMPKKEFSAEFRLAVADLIRDKYITGDAYKKGYDKHPLVTRNENMWRDNLLALYQRKKVIKGMKTGKASGYSLVKSYLDPLMSTIREKYRDQIFINTDAFEKIKLTSVNMFVVQQNLPFPVPVPEFPQLTAHNKLDYGQKM